MKKGLLAALFDLSFDTLITTKLVRVAYVLLLATAGLLAISWVIFGFGRGFTAGIINLIIAAPLLFLAIAVLARIYCELVLVLFRIQEHTAETAALLRAGARGTERPGATPSQPAAPIA